MKLYSTLDRSVVEIKPLVKDRISIYSCGPTVYYRMHIGNIRAYVSFDVLHRAFLYLGHNVKRVMNLTDVGHMTNDTDFGEDKIEESASSEGVEPIEIADRYIRTVLEDFSKMNILSPSGKNIDSKLDISRVKEYGFLRATEYVDKMIEMIQEIEKNGYTYETEQAVYFDVSKMSDYTIFTGQALDEKEEGVRDEVNVDLGKRHPADFVLWMKRVDRYENHSMYWNSPWGDGFPGWHIECSAMSIDALGNEFDIHTGGIDHIPIHHPNERAQNIGAMKNPVVSYWIHNEWLVVGDNIKMSKSEGSLVVLDDILNMGFDVLDLRYLFVSVNYHIKINFSKEALEGARNSRMALVSKLRKLRKETNGSGNILLDYKQWFEECLNDSLNISKGFALINEMIKSNEKPEDVLTTIYDFDKVLSLDLEASVEMQGLDVPEDILKLVEKREEARKSKDFELADLLRDKIGDRGYVVVDTSTGFNIEKI
ncbi:cysteine--tRNA ligase [bacterium]|nr:cysteine--tRNA ligase [bacterium]